MAKKLMENPGGVAQERQPIVDPVPKAMATANRAKPNPQPIYYQRGIPGRDGTGEWLVGQRGAVMMPNGDYARTGDTFNQRDEGFNDAQIRHLAGQFIEPNRDKTVKPHMVRKPLVAGIVTKEAAGGSGKADPASC